MTKTKKTMETKQAQFRVTKRLTEDVIGELLNIKNKHGLTAHNIVKIAKNRKSPLHSLFEWNDTVAAEQHRLWQARVLVNEVKVVVDDVEYSAFENVNVFSDDDGLDGSEREYKELSEIMSSKDLRRQVLQSALQTLNYWKQKYAEYNEFEPVVEAIDKVGKKLMKSEKLRWQKN